MLRGQPPLSRRDKHCLSGAEVAEPAQHATSCIAADLGAGPSGALAGRRLRGLAAATPTAGLLHLQACLRKASELFNPMFGVLTELRRKEMVWRIVCRRRAADGRRASESLRRSASTVMSTVRERAIDVHALQVERSKVHSAQPTECTFQPGACISKPFARRIWRTSTIALRCKNGAFLEPFEICITITYKQRASV